ncbi:hypothetical protein WDW37_01055 [Bdellovibrionota bacterium FG-1]
MQARKLKTDTSKRVNVMVPEEVRDLFSWLVKYDPKYGGVEAAVAADLLRAGAMALYGERLKQAEPLDKDVHDALAKQSLNAFKKAAGA